MFREKIKIKIAEAEALKAKGDAMSVEDVQALDGIVASIEQMQDAQKKLDGANAKLGALSEGHRKAPAAAPANVTSVRERVIDDPAKGFKTPREFFSAIMDRAMYGKRDERLDILAVQGSDEHQVADDSRGGFLVPTAFSPQLLTIGAENDPTVGRTTSIPMQSSRVEIPARVDKNHNTSVAGGLTVSRKEETKDGATSRMAFEKVALVANTLFGASFVTEELLTDSPMSVAALLSAGFNDAFADKALDEKLNGTGVGEFEGVMNNPALVTITKESAQTNYTIMLENILKMRARIWGYRDAIWLANHDTYPQMAKINVGTNANAPIWQPALTEDRPDMLLGRPIFFTEYVPTLGDAGDILLGNWSQYLEGLYQSMQSDESIHVRFLANERAFRFYLRNDGRCWWRAPLTPKKSSATMSPFVALGARK